MPNRLEKLWNSADDGAFSPIGPVGLRNRAEVDSDEMLDAWYHERQHSIELELLIDESSKMIRRLLAEAEVSPESRRSARRLIQTIEATLQADSSDDV